MWCWIFALRHNGGQVCTGSQEVAKQEKRLERRQERSTCTNVSGIFPILLYAMEISSWLFVNASGRFTLNYCPSFLLCLSNFQKFSIHRQSLCHIFISLSKIFIKVFHSVFLKRKQFLSLFSLKTPLNNGVFWLKKCRTQSKYNFDFLIKMTYIAARLGFNNWKIKYFCNYFCRCIAKKEIHE